jgi:hypothetical protein
MEKTRMSKPLNWVARTLLVGLGLAFGASNASAEGNGLLGVYFDDQGAECSTTMSPGQVRTMHVVFAPDGDTRNGFTGAEFRITVENGDGYLFHSEVGFMLVKLGNALGTGTQIIGGDCLSGFGVAIMRFQVQSLSGGDDVVIRVEVHETPSAPQFPCPLVTLCEGPEFTKVCVQTGRAVINPTGSIACGSSSESTEWGRVKALYR